MTSCFLCDSSSTSIDTMIQTSPLLNVVCRPALAQDLVEIKEFCKTIWDGHDYIAEVIDDWFHDPTGMFAVAEYEGHAIACSKITRAAEGQWWLEGFRVDPNHQGFKIGSQIHHYVCQWWLDHCDGTLRLMTNSRNKSVHHLCEQTGFSRLFEARGYKAKPLEGDAHSFTPADSRDPELESAIEFARASVSLAHSNCVVDFGWRCFDPLDKDTLRGLLSSSSDLKSQLFWWRGEKGLLIAWEDDEPDEGKHTLGIGVLACELEDMADVLTDVRHLAAAQNKTSLFWIAPVHEPVERSLAQAGYFSEWDNTTYIFAKKHPHEK